MRRRRHGPWRRQLVELTRGAAGGLVFGVPLLYTMEVWEVGELAGVGRVLLGLALGFVPVALLVTTSGFRSRPQIGGLGWVIDSVTALGWSLLLAGLVLLILRRVTFSMSLLTNLGIVVYEGIPFAVGFAVASEMFASGRTRDEQEQQHEAAERKDEKMGTVRDLGAAAIGALFLALNIAPTDEVWVLAAGIEGLWLAGLVLLSLVSAYGIVFVAGFSDQKKRREQEGVLQHPLTETVASYVVGLIVSALLLLFYDNLFSDAPSLDAVRRIAVLGFPAAVGGAAGRVVV